MLPVMPRPRFNGFGAALLFRKSFDHRAVRDGRLWKLVRDQNLGRWELYNIEADRTETRDLAKQHPERVEQLAAAWQKWADRDRCEPQPISNYTLFRVPENLPPIKISMIGDSTMSSYAKPPADRPTLTGWGQVFGLYFNDSVQVHNHAASGRSSKSFLKEGRWEPVLAEKPNYVFIQFGHNDQPGKGDRTTDPNTNFEQARALANLTFSSEYFDVLTRDPETAERGQTRNLAYLNQRSILYPTRTFDLEIYARLPLDLAASRF